MQAIEAEWTAALRDAELDASQARIHMFEGEASPSGVGALWGAPGENLRRKDFPFEGNNAAFIRLNNEERELHRVAVWGGQRPILVAAKMRHELEHARQYEAHGQELFHLHGLMNAILDLKVGGLPGGGVVYGSIPMEVDGNAAAARFVHGRYATEAEALLREHHPDSGLLRSLCGPGPLETLPARMICFAYQYADIGEDWTQARGWGKYAAVIDNMWPGAHSVWDALDAMR